MRHRHQKGSVELTKAGTWKAHWFEYVRDPETGAEVRTHRSRILGTKSEMWKYEAEDLKNKIVAALNASGNSRNDDRVTLEWFWENRFRPMREGGWGPATKRGCATDWAHYVKPHLGHLALNQIGLYEAQKHVNVLAAEGFSEPVVKRAKTMVSSMLELATDLEFIHRNPAAKAKLPVCKPTQKPTLEEEDIVRLLNAVTDPRDHLILLIGIFCALPSSELFGLTWDAYMGDHLIIRNTAYQGELYQWRVKRKARFRRVPIPPSFQKFFNRWKLLSKPEKPSALIFPGREGRPMWSGIFLQDHIRPIAKKLGIKVPITFQVMRRSCATRNQENGNLKDVQAHLGHSNIQTTANVYIQPISANVREMVESDVRHVLKVKHRKIRKEKKAQRDN